MIKLKLTIFRRFTIITFCLIAIMGLLFIIVTYLATTNYQKASTQLLNKDVAKHVAEFTSAFTSAGINKRKADSVFKNAMVLNPNVEVYFLDAQGKVIYFEASDNEIKVWNIPLAAIKKFIANNGEIYIKGLDPKDPANPKIFSASEVRGDHNFMGYIYVIVGSKKSESIMNLLLGSHIFNLALKAFLAIIIISFIFSYLNLKRVRKNFEHMISVLEKFEAGDYSARFKLNELDELKPVTNAFNKMADLLSSNINKLTTSEQDRKNFIAIISHDLRTPLSIVRGYAETILLNKEKVEITPEDQEKYLHLILDKMMQVDKMVKQLFELSKMEDVEFKPMKEPFVLSEIVQEVINTSLQIAQKKIVSLSCVQCLYHVWINADISMMERVVQNLVDNALNNTPAGGTIQAAMVVDNNELIFKIENDGVPLPADIITWINNFTSGGSLLENRPQKLGLGFLIVQKILDRHNTSLKTVAENQKNIFSFRFPIYHFPS